MKNKERYFFTFCWVIFFCYFSSDFLNAKSSIEFYSQPSQLALKNLNNILNYKSSTRKIFPLIGEWNIYEQEKKIKIGSINIPAVYHVNQSYIFSKKFPKIENSTSHYRLHLDGINGYSHIRINHRLFFKGNNNYLPIRLLLDSNLLNDSTNLLEIKIEKNRDYKNRIPSWFPINLPRIDYGIPGNVYLEVLPPVNISEINAKLESEANNLLLFLDLNLEMPSNMTNNIFLDLKIFSKNNLVWQDQKILQISFEAEKNTKLQLLIPKLEPWSPENPNCYQLKLSIKRNNTLLDETWHNLSFSEPFYKNKHIFLNDEPLYINGINYINQDSKGISIPNAKLYKKDLEKIKSMGFNAIRVPFYPQSSLFYSITDSLGLLVFQDLPFPFVYKYNSKDSLLNLSHSKYVTNFLKIATQHPSVVCIGFPEYLETKVSAHTLKNAANQILKKNFLAYRTTPIKLNEEQNSFPVSVFEVLERNHLEESLKSLQNIFPRNFPVLLSGLSKPTSYRMDSITSAYDLQQIISLNTILNQENWQKQISGKFILTYSDFYLETPALQVSPENDFTLNTVGLTNLQRELKPEVKHFEQKKYITSQETKKIIEKKDIGQFSFILFGLVNLLMFMFLYRSQVDFKQNIHRAIKRPYGFFIDLYERRHIQYVDSFFLLCILAFNGAIITGSILYYFRNNLFLDYILSILLLSKDLKLTVCHLIWKPHLSVPFLSIILMFIVILFTIPIKIISLFTEPRIRIRQAIATSTWAASHFVLLLPVGMFFYNLLLVFNSYWILFAVLLYFHIWYLKRWQNGTRVMTEQPFSRVFLFSFATFIIAGMGYFYFLQNKIELIQHLKFLINLFHLVN
jgi:hypothetical protein